MHFVAGPFRAALLAIPRLLIVGRTDESRRRWQILGRSPRHARVIVILSPQELLKPLSWTCFVNLSSKLDGKKACEMSGAEIHFLGVEIATMSSISLHPFPHGSRSAKTTHSILELTQCRPLRLCTLKVVLEVQGFIIRLTGLPNLPSHS